LGLLDFEKDISPLSISQIFVNWRHWMIQQFFLAFFVCWPYFECILFDIYKVKSDTVF
jgi:hypothetical protein